MRWRFAGGSSDERVHPEPPAVLLAAHVAGAAGARRVRRGRDAALVRRTARAWALEAHTARAAAPAKGDRPRQSRHDAARGRVPRSCRPPPLAPRGARATAGPISDPLDPV